MSFARMQEALRAEGWFVEWNMPCCQSCAWGAIPYEHEVGPFKGQEVDLDKVLFNHSQDCEVYVEGEECTECHGEGIVENPDYDTDQLAEEHDDDLDEFIDCPECFGVGEVNENLDLSDDDYDTSVSGFICETPATQSDSSFCFGGSKKGVANLNLAYKIIEESGCKILWNGRGDSRPTISWD